MTHTIDITEAKCTEQGMPVEQGKCILPIPTQKVYVLPFK